MPQASLKRARQILTAKNFRDKYFSHFLENYFFQTLISKLWKFRPPKRTTPNKGNQLWNTVILHSAASHFLLKVRIIERQPLYLGQRYLEHGGQAWGSTDYFFLSFSHSVTHHLDKWWLLSNMTKSWQVLNIIWHADSHSFQAHSIEVKFPTPFITFKAAVTSNTIFPTEQENNAFWDFCFVFTKILSKLIRVMLQSQREILMIIDSLYHHYLVHGTWQKNEPSVTVNVLHVEVLHQLPGSHDIFLLA